MSPEAVVRDRVEVMLDGPDASVLRLGLLVPQSGPLGLTGPSAVAAASLAASEVNAAGGVEGRRVELVLADAGELPAQVAASARALADYGAVDAFVGLHTSDVHRAVEGALAGRLPYIFTPPHEGGTRLPGVVLLGDSPAEQLSSAVAWLSQRRRLRRWALIGSDYIWAWAVHRAARPLVRAAGGSVDLERFVPFGLEDGDDADALVEAVGRAGVDAVLLSLVGRDLAMFNRAYARSNLGPRVVRLSGALEENGLLAAGGDETGELYAAMRSFAGQADPRRVALAERVEAAFGAGAPVLDAYAEGCYDGVHLAAAMAATTGSSADLAQAAAARLLSGEDSAWVRRAWSRAPLGPPSSHGFLAHADGLALEVVTSL